MAEYRLKLPVSEQDVRQLRAGDIVYLTGTFFTARDQAHIKMRELYRAGQSWPFHMENTAVFHAGPIVAKREDGGYDLKVIGPTSSVRMDPYAEMMGKMGVRIIIGKGGMSAEANKIAKKYGYVYLQASPGCAAFYGHYIKKINDVTWPEIGMTEAVWNLEAEDFGPLIVGLDTTGHNLHQDVKDRAMDRAIKKYQ